MNHFTPKELADMHLGENGHRARQVYEDRSPNERTQQYQMRREETRKRKNRGGDPKGEVEEKSSEKTRAGRLRKRRGESQSFLIRVAVQESKTRMRNNALRTGPRQAVERAVSKRGYHTGYRHGNY
ncbi:hypothetical protein TNCV_1951071 [Trichonephila clavipes]|nr:hypothetical protein TNCV_1951071 [Trichonephila clavipes]